MNETNQTDTVPSPMEEPIVATEFVVEGLNLMSQRWEPWGCWDEKGKSLNPSGNREAARVCKSELDDYRYTDESVWTDSRIVEVITSRRVVG